jgi:hypothetical protein
MSMKPTDEQQAIIDAYGTGQHLVIEAGAGTGKTTTLRMLGGAKPGRKGVYVAFGREIAQEAKRTFPRDVQCATAHSFAFGAVGRQFAHRLNGPRMPAWEVARVLGINEPIRATKDVLLAPQQVARLAMETAYNFCKSADREPLARHVPRKPGFDGPDCLAALRDVLPPLAARAWTDLTSREGRLRFSHDVYLKMWQLSGPRLPADYVLLDEAQDADPVIAAVVLGQSHAQLIAVGDRCQSIYRWRGAIDAMSKFPADVRLPLAQSFRFGHAIAGEANKWLQVLDSPLRLRGHDPVRSVVATIGSPGVILCRTNATAMTEAMDAMETGRKVAIIGGGGKDILGLAEAAVTLKAGTGCVHPELFAFQTWGEVQDYAENDPGGSDLAVFVKLIDDHGPEEIIAAARQLSDERYANLIISTAHKAKGREWDTVQVAGDFREPKKKKRDDDVPKLDPHQIEPEDDDELGEINRDEAMLAYVAVTRARHILDRSGLVWVDKYL